MIDAPRVGVPDEFVRALDSLSARPSDAGIVLREVEGPRRISPFSVAFEASVREPGPRADDDLASGRLVILYDPDGQVTWNGSFRVVSLTRATLDADMAADPLFPTAAWSWLEEALDNTDAHTLGGTVTRVLSESFGALSTGMESVEVEIRASWSPSSTELSDHLHAWFALLRATAGLPPFADGVTVLRPRHGTMGL